MEQSLRAKTYSHYCTQKSSRKLSKGGTISGSGLGPILQKAYQFEGLPTIVFNDSMELNDAKESIQIIHFPNAQTDRDASPTIGFKKCK